LKWLLQGGSNKYSPLGLRNHYSYMPPWILHRLFIHGKKQGPELTYSLVYIQKRDTTCFHQSFHFFGLWSFASRCKQPLRKASHGKKTEEKRERRRGQPIGMLQKYYILLMCTLVPR
jgi:hypothetical protein